MNQESMYNKLSDIYDKLYSYKNYGKEAKFIHDTADYYGITNNSQVLDLACGTGKHAGELLKLGYTVTGLDSNDGMLEVARQKYPKSLFIKGDLSSLKLSRNYSVITCLFSSIQYVTSSSALSSSFHEIYSRLTKGGLFIFDLGYCQERWKEGHNVLSVYKDDKQQIAMFAQSNSIDGISYWKPVIFIKQAGVVDMEVDEHEIRIYSVPDIQRMLIETGFSVEIYESFENKSYVLGTSTGVPVFVALK